MSNGKDKDQENNNKKTTSQMGERGTQKSQIVKRRMNLCEALKELAAFERKEGTENFVNSVINIPRWGDFTSIATKGLDINHHPVADYSSHPSGVEETEFIDTEGVYQFFVNYRKNALAKGEMVAIPHQDFIKFINKYGGYIDIEYVEIAYALKKRNWNPFTAHWVFNSMKDAAGGESGVKHPPNWDGIVLGDYIATGFSNLTEFVNIFCNKCSHIKNGY